MVKQLLNPLLLRWAPHGQTMSNPPFRRSADPASCWRETLRQVDRGACHQMVDGRSLVKFLSASICFNGSSRKKTLKVDPKW